MENGQITICVTKRPKIKFYVTAKSNETIIIKNEKIMWTGNKKLDQLRSKAAASDTGVIPVSIEELNEIGIAMNNARVEISKKTRFKHWRQIFYRCPNCDYDLLVGKEKYCSNCGIKILWN